MVITKVAANDAVMIGDEMTFAISFANVGNAIAPDVVVSDALPPGYIVTDVEYSIE